jgi:hypothetical protein
MSPLELPRAVEECFGACAVVKAMSVITQPARLQVAHVH